MSAQRTTSLRGRPVAALCGGVGGAKLALGLERLIGADLTVIVNTGDDFEHLGLHVSPDIDTVVYTLGGLSDLERGWGRADESWNFMEALGGLAPGGQLPGGMPGLPGSNTQFNLPPGFNKFSKK